MIELALAVAFPKFPSLSTLSDPRSLIVVTDYPGEGTLGNLKMKVKKSRRCDKRPPMFLILCKIVSPVFAILSYYVSYPVLVGIFYAPTKGQF